MTPEGQCANAGQSWRL